MLKAIKVLFVLVGLVIGLPTMAFAHAGHEHPIAPSHEASAKTSATRVSAPIQFEHVRLNVAQAKASLKPVAVALSYVSILADHSTSDLARGCVGACCCQGHSTCSMGSCCFTALTTSSALTYFAGRQSFRPLTPDSLVQPSLIFGLDRPPKA